MPKTKIALDVQKLQKEVANLKKEMSQLQFKLMAAEDRAGSARRAADVALYIANKR